MNTGKAAVAEFFGTFWLVFGGTGAAVLAASVGNSGIGWLGVALAFGLTVVTMAYAVGHISGGHFNPAVTLGAAAAGRARWADVIPYILAQAVGGILAAFVLWLVLLANGTADIATGFAGVSNGFGDASPGGYGLGPVIILEAAITAIFVWVILGVTAANSTTSGFAPLAIGLTLTAMHIVAIPVDNASLNPVRSLAPAVFGGISQAARPLLPEFRRYLLVGGFPETAQQASVEIAQQILREDVVERVLRRDLVALYAVRSVREFEQLFIYLCLHTGGIFAVKTVATALGVAAPTVENHLEVLEQAHLIYRLPPIAISGKKILKAKDKIYIADAALRNAVLLKGDQILDDPAEMGLVAETTVLRHVFAFYYQDTPRVSHWLAPAASGGKRGRPKAGEERGDERLLEVDIVVQSPSYTIPFEVKYRDTAALHAASGLVAFCREEKLDRAYFVTKRNEDFGVSTFPDHRTKYLRIPAHILTCLLGRAERTQWRGKTP